ncbi:Major sperm protein [Trichuris trichiura]|uniref:Major sperm protein n=1 Tax=Trichuris trichiura TaxID=36087 RepID=A0A077Z9P9_TRITR|nr:Major sperm protein [Trichuris trichiura]
MAAQDEVKTQPDKRFSFNAPYSKDQVYAIRLTDDGPKPVMWTIQSTAPDRIKFSAENGYLPPTESTNVTVTLNPFEFKDGLNDRFNIEWINVPDDGPKAFDMEYMQKCDVIKKKVITIHYNL